MLGESQHQEREALVHDAEALFPLVTGPQGVSPDQMIAVAGLFEGYPIPEMESEIVDTWLWEPDGA